MADLITLARAQMIPSLSGADATYLAELISTASKMVQRYCKRDFTDTTYTDEVYDGEGTDYLMLKQFPIIALTTVTVVESDGTEDDCDGSKFRIDYDIGEIRHAPDCDCTYTYFVAGFRNIMVTYEAGFATIPKTCRRPPRRPSHGCTPMPMPPQTSIRGNSAMRR